MSKLTKVYEKQTKKGFQVIEISAMVNSITEVENINYDDYVISFYLDGVFKGDMSGVFGTMPIYFDLIDATDWLGLWLEQVPDDVFEID